MKADKIIFIVFVLILLEVPVKIIALFLFCVMVYLNKEKFIQEKFSVPISNQNLMGNTSPIEPVYTTETNQKLQKFLADNQQDSLRAFYYEDIFRPIEDYFNKKNGYRQFVPNPEVSGNFVDSYKNMPSCKDDPSYCFAYVDNRYK